jgi:putative transposase
VSQDASVKRLFGHRARLALSPAGVSTADAQAHAARTMWNLLHAWWQMMPKDKRTPAHADAAIRQARKDLDFLAVLPAQAAQAVLKTYVQAWKNCWEGRADAPKFKARFRSVMSVDIPQGRDLNIKRVHRRWGMVNLPRIGRIRFRWTKDLPVGKRANTENRITGARLIKDALGWHIAFRVTTLEPRPEPHRGGEAGIDVGITVPLALSDGTTYEHGEWLTEKETAKLLRLEQRAAQRKQHQCIDCGNCEPVCPVEAISQDRRVPPELKLFVADNKRFFTDPLPGRDEPIGTPGGATGHGPIGADTELVAAYDPRG